jgi:hypothetical protein
MLMRNDVSSTPAPAVDRLTPERLIRTVQERDLSTAEALHLAWVAGRLGHCPEDTAVEILLPRVEKIKP